MSGRTKIPEGVRAEILRANRHACAVCQKRRVQLHHIDGDPSNHAVDNLAALCLEHHDMATMTGALTRKLTASDVIHYKTAWEGRCAADDLALARDRINYYVSLYKNPPRIFEAFFQLSVPERERAIESVLRFLQSEHEKKEADKGFEWQVLPKNDDYTKLFFLAAHAGERWPRFLHRVRGHPDDEFLPIELGPPHGMTAFHGYDLYCQILVQLLMSARGCMPLERIYECRSVSEMQHFVGRLVHFREDAVGDDVQAPRATGGQAVGRVELARRIGRRDFGARMAIRNMYVFSDTSAENLRRANICGIGILGGVSRPSPRRVEMNIVPLLMGMGGFGQSDENGWWNFG